MPIPNPKGGESQDEFVSRCIQAIYDEYGEKNRQLSATINLEKI